MGAIVTGHTLVMVRLAEPKGGEVAVRRGDALPEGLADGEMARLTKVGAFDPPAVADLAGQGARHAKPQALPVGLLLATSPESDGPLLATAEILLADDEVVVGPADVGDVATVLATPTAPPAPPAPKPKR